MDTVDLFMTLAGLSEVAVFIGLAGIAVIIVRRVAKW